MNGSYTGDIFIALLISSVIRIPLDSPKSEPQILYKTDYYIKSSLRAVSQICAYKNYFYFTADERNEKEETAPSEGFRAVTLPHDWSTDYPFDPESDTCGSGGYAKAGIGWYQRTITISENDIKADRLFCILRAFT